MNCCPTTRTQGTRTFAILWRLSDERSRMRRETSLFGLRYQASDRRSSLINALFSATHPLILSFRTYPRIGRGHTCSQAENFARDAAFLAVFLWCIPPRRRDLFPFSQKIPLRFQDDTYERYRFCERNLFSTTWANIWESETNEKDQNSATLPRLWSGS